MTTEIWTRDYYATAQAVTDAIEQSVQRTDIVHIVCTERDRDDVAELLFEACDGDTDANDGAHEYWGTLSETEDRDAAEWRVSIATR